MAHIYGRFTATIGPQIHGAARGKNAFPKIIIDPVCHAASISKGPSPNVFLKNKKG
jgi:hypothetical protein